MRTYFEARLGEPLPGEAQAKVPFTSPIFFGSDRCTEEVDRAHAQLDEVFNHVSGLQQPCHPESDEQARECQEAEALAWAYVRSLARSLVIAMGCEEILKPEVPPDPQSLTGQVEELTRRVRELEADHMDALSHAHQIIEMLQKV
jgi:hypothetical protein